MARRDWAGWTRALEILWTESKSKSWGFQPVGVRLAFESERVSLRLAEIVMDALEEKGVLMGWRDHVRDLVVEKVDREGRRNYVVVTIERRTA